MSETQPEPLFHEWFEERARKVPRDTALHEGDRSITYSDLGARAGRVAGGLRSRGIQQGCSVGLHLERSIDWVVGLLGILKAGAAVVPLPPSYPVGRLREILDFAGLDAVVDHAETPLDPSLTVDAIHLAELSSETGASEGSAAVRPDQPAFVLASSGSTGRPKMIVRSHRSFFHRLRWTWTRHPFAPGEVCCQKAHMTTTHAIYELFEPLLHGTPVVIVPDHDVRNLESFWKIVRARRVSRLLIVPSALRASLDMPGFAAPPLEVVVLMGEYVHPGLAERAVAAFPVTTRLYSIYGSTEASSTLVCDLRESLRPGEELPLGKPISPDVRPLVLGSDLESVAPGHAGRLHMAGPALFSEYLGDPTLTASAFVDVRGHAGPLYDTRDEVHRLPDGSLQFIGRADHTVKIRGFRVELPEVERAILLHSQVRQATVVVEESHPGNARLVGFFVPAAIDPSGVYDTLREQLPAYMVPSALVGLDAFPLTPSSKVDRVKLLEEFRAGAASPPSSRAPSETEQRVREAWGRVVGHGSFGLDTSFFEAGGDSLSVFTLVNLLRETFGLEAGQLTAQSAYRHSTVAEMAAWVDDVAAGRAPDRRRATPLLVPLRKGSDGDQAPLFFISSAGGTLGAYDRLAKTLSTSRDIVGVGDPFLWGERDPTEGFGRWVERYLEAIRDRQPRGPYFLGAYSSAAAFGYEIARRLREDDQEVALLALIDPLSLDQRTPWRYGYWVLRGTYMRPLFRELIRLGGWLRVPALRALRAVRAGEVRNEHAFSSEEVARISEAATRGKGHLLILAALLELNTGLPFALDESDLRDVDPDQYLGILQARVKEVTPDVDPSMIERVAVQYNLQVRTQNAYELAPYDGPVLLVEPVSRYTGLVEAQIRPHTRNLQAEAVKVGPPSARTRELSARFGALELHYRCMRDDAFVQGLARELDALLG